MFKPSTAKTIPQYLALLPDERKESIQSLHQIIQKSAPNLKPYFAYNMIGYGSFSYKNYK